MDNELDSYQKVVGSNIVSSNTRWKLCQSHARSINVPNPDFYEKKENIENIVSKMGNTKKTFFKGQKITDNEG